jgi:peptidoglycan/LPS O-acetylase OafA/YrhL
VVAAALERSLQRGEGVPGYLLRRAAKILPLYLVFLHLGIIFFWGIASSFDAPVFYINSISRESLTTDNYLFHLLMLQGLTPARLHSLLDGSWSILCEVYFYLLLPVLLRFLKTPATALAGFALGLSLAVGFTMLVGRHLGDFGYYAFPVQLPCFLLGVYCRRLKEARALAPLGRAHDAALGMGLLMLFFGLSKAQTAPLGIYQVIAVLFAVALLFMRLDAANVLSRGLQALGRQSYALFLLHLLILKSAFAVLASLGVQMPLIVALLAYGALGFGLSWFLSNQVFNRMDEFVVRRADAFLRLRWIVPSGERSPFPGDSHIAQRHEEGRH